MLEIIGFVVIAFIMFWISVFWVAILFNNSGQYDIGGKPNTAFDKLLVLVAFAIIAYGWYEVYQNCPFSISMKN